MRQSIFAWTALTLLLLGCGPEAPPFSDADRARIEAEIRSARDAYFDAATRLNVDEFVAFWHPDFFHLSNASVLPLTPEGLREGWTPLSHIEMDIDSDLVVALSRDAGFTVLTASYVVFDTSGVAVERSDWAGTHIWIRTNGGWKVRAAHEGRPVQRP